ncbi:uncharacterized protein PGTG_19573 [Puccinia graminis f. sp. tritici CRL 75-36-700-3]|uniref:Uncharacterized protein n=1 Tax=Puccinia graminis f. sp. tritici (strain CRL 75-36-700-3 / race SCCL) TaxID=418459 RepID=E3LBP8_PUCGT|nr:uncharacterized protein PGTG_19573 [Puccinia graminis f. sp. tritici CRL 75-36-700-3]EFP93973.2 hypothetical protein PGTG_19573 [Puccinia graminis f. sp. tritici CRL 75-36-700-3]
MPTGRPPPDEAASIDFEPYNPANHKAELASFIYKVDSHAIIPSKIKVDPLRDLAQEYLDRLILRQSAQNSPHSQTASRRTEDASDGSTEDDSNDSLSSPEVSPEPVQLPIPPTTVITPSPPPRRGARSPGRARTGGRSRSPARPAARSQARAPRLPARRAPQSPARAVADRAPAPARPAPRLPARAPRSQARAAADRAPARAPRSARAQSPAKTPSKTARARPQARTPSRTRARSPATPSRKQAQSSRHSADTRGRSPSRRSKGRSSSLSPSPKRAYPRSSGRAYARTSASPSPRNARPESRAPNEKKRMQSQSPQRKSKKRHVSFEELQPKRHSKLPVEDESTSGEDSSLSESSSLTSQSGDSNSDSESDNRASRKSKGKNKAPAKDKYWDQAKNNYKKFKSVKSAQPLKSALVTGKKLLKNHIINIDSGTDTNTRRHNTRSGRRPPRRSPSPAYEDLCYAEEGRQDANSYSRPKISPFLQLPPDRERSNQDVPAQSHNQDPQPRRRRYIQMGGGSQTFAAAGIDYHQGKDHPSEWRFTPAPIPFCPTLARPHCPSTSHLAQSPHSLTATHRYPSVAPSYGYHTSQSNVGDPASPQFNIPPAFPQSNVPPAFQVAPAFQPLSTQASAVADSQEPGPPALGRPKPFDYSQYWPKVESQNQNLPIKKPSNRRPAPSSNFNFSYALGIQEKPDPQPLGRFNQTLEKQPPPPPLCFGQSAHHAKQPHALPPRFNKTSDQSIRSA